MADRAYGVYVIELAPGAGRRRDSRIPWVYVGSSARSPEDRLAQHRRGYRSARLAKRHAVRLRPDLYEDLEPQPTSRAGVEAEHLRAIELAGAGFVAHSDGVSYGEGSLAWAEWDAARLDRVGRHADLAIEELAACAFAPLDPATCAQLLHGERGFWIADYIDPADPPPSYGLFGHVRLDALEARARRSQARATSPA